MDTTASIDSHFRSQWGQDKFIFENLMDFEDGTFFEVGAHDGEQLSNTFFFETTLHWSGILVEMQPHLFDDICRKRPRAKVFSCGLAPEPAHLLWSIGDRSACCATSTFSRIPENHYQAIEPKPSFE